MESEILQGFLPLLKVCIDPLPEDDNLNFESGYPTAQALFVPWYNTIIQYSQSLNHLFFSLYLLVLLLDEKGQ